MHPSSVNAERSKFASPWLVYHEKVETSAVYLRDSTVRSPPRPVPVPSPSRPLSSRPVPSPAMPLPSRPIAPQKPHMVEDATYTCSRTLPNPVQAARDGVGMSASALGGVAILAAVVRRADLH